MKTVIAASFLLSLASLTTASTVGYTLRAESSNKAINGKAVNANGNAFWIGKPTASFCPSQVPQDACPKGNETEILVGNDPSQPCQEHAICGGAGMSTIVPGGQQVYIAPELALSFTVAHSGFIPTNSTVEKFSLQVHGVFGWDAPKIGTPKWSACPVGNTADKKPVATFQIFGQKDGKLSKYQKRHCVNDVVITASPKEQYGAWQYT